MRDVKARLAYALGFTPLWFISFVGPRVGGRALRLQRNRTLQTWRHQLQKGFRTPLNKLSLRGCRRLRPCKMKTGPPSNGSRPLNDLTIDVGRDTTALLNKYREGLISPDRLTIPTDGVPASAALAAKAGSWNLPRNWQKKKACRSRCCLGALGSTGPRRTTSPNRGRKNKKMYCVRAVFVDEKAIANYHAADGAVMELFREIGSGATVCKISPPHCPALRRMTLPFA